MSRSSTRRDSVNQSLLTKVEKQTKSTDKDNGKIQKNATPESKKAPEKAAESQSDTLQTTDFQSFQQEIRNFFEQYDNKLDKRLNKFDEKFTVIFQDLKKEIGTIRTEVYEAKTELGELKKKVDDVEKSLEFQAQEMEEKDDTTGSIIRKYTQEIEELKKKLLYQEKHDRRYNLLFYGFPEQPKENIETLMKDFFKDKLEMTKTQVDAIIIANTHRIYSETTGPKPIIMKFARMADRDSVFDKAFHPVLRLERKRILSDLPVPMKKERGRLAKMAYTIRQTEKLQTRIVEKGLSLYLEVRTEKGQPWERRSTDESDPDIE